MSLAGNIPLRNTRPPQNLIFIALINLFKFEAIKLFNTNIGSLGHISKLRPVHLAAATTAELSPQRMPAGRGSRGRLELAA